MAENGKTVLKAEIPTRQSLIVFFDDFAPEELKTPWNERVAESTQLDFDGAWERSLCRGIDYPAFGEKETVTLPDDLAGQHPKFSGVIAYENTFTLEKDYKELLLEISDAYEGVQVYVNGQSAGIQIVPVYRFDLSAFTAPGKNALRIEVSTTLERERRAGRESILEILQHNKVMQPTGITGTVTLYGRD